MFLHRMICAPVFCLLDWAHWQNCQISLLLQNIGCVQTNLSSPGKVLQTRKNLKCKGRFSAQGKFSTKGENLNTNRSFKHNTKLLTCGKRKSSTVVNRQPKYSIQVELIQFARTYEILFLGWLHNRKSMAILYPKIDSACAEDIWYKLIGSADLAAFFCISELLNFGIYNVNCF